MKWIYIVLSILLLTETIQAKSIKCTFEEVYQDGELQSGLVLFYDGLLRYQYDDKQLFTIIYNNDYFLIRNEDISIVNKIENDELLDTLSEILSNYPNIQNVYKQNDIKVKIEESFENQFIRRISIVSNKINLSIYFNNCSFNNLSKKYFLPLNLVNIQ